MLACVFSMLKDHEQGADPWAIAKHPLRLEGFYHSIISIYSASCSLPVFRCNL